MVSGMIGLGKSSLCDLLAQEYGYNVIRESVEDNPILPFLYTATKEEEQRERYPFLLQLWFLQDRYEAMKKAVLEGNTILDRCIYEDTYFAEKFLVQGKINQNEFMIYRRLLNGYMADLERLEKKENSVMVYLKGSFETVLERISNRGRLFELGDELREYYYDIWRDYDKFICERYKSSKVIIIDTDKFDFVNNTEDKRKVLEIIRKGIGE